MVFSKIKWVPWKNIRNEMLIKWTQKKRNIIFVSEWVWNFSMITHPTFSIYPIILAFCNTFLTPSIFELPLLAPAIDRVSKKLIISEQKMTFSVQFWGKFKNFLLKNFFMIFQNGRDMPPDIYVVKLRIFPPVYMDKF